MTEQPPTQRRQSQDGRWQYLAQDGYWYDGEGPTPSRSVDPESTFETTEPGLLPEATYEQSAEPPPTPTTISRRSRRPWVLGGLALVLAGAAIGIALGTSSSTGETVHGNLKLTDTTAPFPGGGGGCSRASTDGYGDITQGAQIVAKNGAGVTIGTGTLGAGNDPVSDPQGIECDFSFTVSVPTNATFYQFTIGRRGGPTYSLAQMKQMNWNVGLALGS